MKFLLVDWEKPAYSTKGKKEVKGEYLINTGVKDPRRRKKAGLFSIVFVSLKYTKSKGMGG
jgi:hypothetical protein